MKKNTWFIAFSLWLDARLWSADKQLIEGLEKKGFKNFITTAELMQFYKK